MNMQSANLKGSLLECTRYLFFHDENSTANWIPTSRGFLVKEWEHRTKLEVTSVRQSLRLPLFIFSGGRLDLTVKINYF